MQFLTFALVAPLGSMGGLAVGEQRNTWDHPARSAVLGLIAGCLGLRRTEEDHHAALATGLGLATRRLGAATGLLSDYHTAQSTPTRRGRAPATRREELAGERETILTRRDYRVDIAFTLVLWQRAPTSWTLQQLADALRRPAFTPYLGRKSCPLGLPMAPRVVEAPTVAAALQARDRLACAEERAALGDGEGTVWADEAAAADPPLGLPETGVTTERRRDGPGSRVRRQFSLRTERAMKWPAA